MFYGVAPNFRIYKKRKHLGEKTESAQEYEKLTRKRDRQTGAKETDRGRDRDEIEKENRVKMRRKRGRRV